MFPNLKLELWRHGMRQNRLAQLLGVDATLLSKVVNGYRVADPELRDRIATILQRDPSWLFAPMKEEILDFTEAKSTNPRDS